MRRNPGGRLVERDTTWQQEAQLGESRGTAYIDPRNPGWLDD
jgi:hypothetical protein